MTDTGERVVVPILPPTRYLVKVVLLDGPVYEDREGVYAARYRVRQATSVRDSYRLPVRSAALCGLRPDDLVVEALHGDIWVAGEGGAAMLKLHVGDRFLIEGSYVEWTWEEV